MSLSRALIAFFFVSVIAFAAVTTVAMNRMLRTGFSDLEMRDVIMGTGRVAGYIDDKVAQLASKNHDWSVWDDLYSFAAGEPSDFWSVEVTSAAMTALDVDFVGIVGRSGLPRQSASIDNSDKSLVDADEDFVDIQRMLPPFTEQEPDGYQDALLTIGATPMLVAARPILKSDGTGSVAGTVYFAKVIRPAFWLDASTSLHQQIAQVVVGEEFIAPAAASAAGEAKEITVSGDGDTKYLYDASAHYAATMVTRDLDQRQVFMVLDGWLKTSRALSPALQPGAQTSVLRLLIKADRPIMQLGWNVSRDVIALVIVLNVLLWMLFLAFIWRFLVQRLQHFESILATADTLDSGVEEQLNAFAPEPNNNEIDRLARSATELLRRTEAAELSRDEALERLVSSSKLAGLGEMAGGIAHEINNPLTVISGRARQMRSIVAKEGGPSADNLVKLADSIESTVQRIAAIVRSLRKHSRESVNEPMARADVRRIVDEALDLCRDQLKQHDIRLMIVDSGEILAPCREVQLGQVVMNLLRNAIDAIEELATEHRWIRVRVSSVDRPAPRCIIAIENGGPLISPEIRERIFDPFFTTKPVGKGTGIGLSLSATIIHQHNGHLALDTTKSNTCFVVEIPMNIDSSESSLKKGVA